MLILQTRQGCKFSSKLTNLQKRHLHQSICILNMGACAYKYTYPHSRSKNFEYLIAVLFIIENWGVGVIHASPLPSLCLSSLVSFLSHIADIGSPCIYWSLHTYANLYRIMESEERKKSDGGNISTWLFPFDDYIRNICVRGRKR